MMNGHDAGPALLLIDVQRGFDDPRWGPRNNPWAEQRIAATLAAWRAGGLPVYHVRHGSLNADSVLHPANDGHRFKPEAEPLEHEPILDKSVNSAFIGTGLEERLRQARIGTVVLAGLTTNHCVSTTARMAGNLGFATFVLSDATATFDRRGPNGAWYSADLVHDVSLASLHGEFATVLDTVAALDRFAV